MFDALSDKVEKHQRFWKIFSSLHDPATSIFPGFDLLARSQRISFPRWKDFIRNSFLYVFTAIQSKQHRPNVFSYEDLAHHCRDSSSDGKLGGGRNVHHRGPSLVDCFVCFKLLSGKLLLKYTSSKIKVPYLLPSYICARPYLWSQRFVWGSKAVFWEYTQRESYPLEQSLSSRKNLLPTRIFQTFWANIEGKHQLCLMQRQFF